MRIGIVGSGYDMLPLFSVLNQYENEYHFFCDWKYQSRGSKSIELSAERIAYGIAYLKKTIGVDVVIVPPWHEMVMNGNDDIMPLFHTYLMDHVLPGSLVGKLGVLGDSAVHPEIEKIIKEFIDTYTPTLKQKKIALFNAKFPIRIKSLPMRESFIGEYSSRHWMVRKTIKNDIRYFLDAGVDSLIPLNRGFLHRQRLISQRTNRKNIKFHGNEAVGSSLESWMSGKGGISSSSKNSGYSLTLHYTDLPRPILESKKWKRLLDKGEEKLLVVTKI